MADNPTFSNPANNPGTNKALQNQDEYSQYSDHSTKKAIENIILSLQLEPKLTLTTESLIQNPKPLKESVPIESSSTLEICVQQIMVEDPNQDFGLPI